MSVLTSARQGTGPTVHAALTDGVAAVALPGIAAAASVAAHAEIFHAFVRIEPALPVRPPELGGLSTPGRTSANRPTNTIAMRP
jgi:hypothetical protein